MNPFWSPVVSGLTPYVPGEQPKLPNLIKLNTNENPYPPSPLALEAMKAAVADTLRLYPDPNADELKQTLAHYHGLNANQIFVGNGSDEVLAHAFLGLLKHETPLIFPDITYSFYPVYCGLYGIEYQCIPLEADLSLSIDALIEASPTDKTSAIIFPNPNAPTGRALARVEIERLLQSHPNTLVVVDEAYVDFGAESCVTLVNQYPNLLVIHTFSKSRSLAGLRVGYAVGHADLIEALERVKNSFNSYPLDRVALAGAVASIKDEDYFVNQCQQVIKNREYLIAGLEKLGFEVLPSAANFVFAQHPNHSGLTLAQQLRAESIIVRHFKLPRIENYLRITVGTNQECEKLLNTLQKII